MGELWVHTFLSSCPPSIVNTCNVHLACIKCSSTELKCKWSNKGSCMTHPIPFFFLTLPCQPCILCFATVFRLHWTLHRSRSTRQGVPWVSELQRKPIYFPSSHRLHLRARQRAPIEPLKPLFPKMKEGKQNREIGRKARRRRGV